MKTRLGHYDIVAELGRGGMGVVYKGHESSLNRYVAIKVLADSLAHDEGVKERFLREARSMAALNDPHIIQIYFIGEDEGQTYFVMEFVEGESLGSLLKREHKVPVASAAKIVYQTALGLATAHDKGVIHRDIKPGNLMISSRGAVKIADFGIALSNQDLSKKLTSTGEFVGTPGYLSPEVCLGRTVDQRSDIFSLGIVLFEMLAGRMPFTDESPLGLMLEVVRAEIPDVRELNADVDEKISWILSKMIAKEPDDRYQSCHELAADLAEHPFVAKGGPITLVPKVSAAAATVVGGRTPVSAQRPLSSVPVTPAAPMANTRITPSAQPIPPAYQPSAQTAPGVASGFERQSVLERSAQAPRRSAALPLAIAAALVVCLAGGAWAFRDRLGFGAGGAGGTPSLPPAEPTATLAPVQQAASGTTPATLVADSTPAPSQSASDAQGVAATNGDALPTTQPADSLAQTSAASSQGDALADGPGPRASQADVEALRDLPAARAAEADAPQIAVVTPPKKQTPPAAPRVPTIAVAAAGDDVIADPARDAIVNLLQRRGFRVIEANLGNGSQPNLRSMHGRADAVVYVHAKPVGSQVMTYYGQASTLYTVQMGVKAYRVSDGSTLWSSGAEQVNFTTLNAAEKAQEAVDPLLDAVDRNLDEFRSRRGRG
ncbi:MAG TPA: protein kinase [Dokdonella sp.]|uniref:serine/threonine-protein kinase n=1 Tax=Dokdonella sp. TaxID=2291710 RepID=UPI0025BA58DE|nr:serine/threonine-protein kinase [Dokdonella sp.]MBX3691477.1 protein kinase [Dokdonella sp.]MCW5568326.1 protein kinase [Dokdonella sp.]HNR92276.1 protein kinase [Dokdonella sp.]